MFYVGVLVLFLSLKFRSYQNLIFLAAIIVRKHLVRRKKSKCIFSPTCQWLNRMYVVNALKAFLVRRYWKYMKIFTSLMKNVSYGPANHVIRRMIFFLYFITYIVFRYFLVIGSYLPNNVEKRILLICLFSIQL